MPIIVDRNIDAAILNFLRGLNTEIIFSCPNDFIYEPVNTHPDIQIHILSPGLAITDPRFYDYYSNEFANLNCNIKLITGSRPLTFTYPGNVAYNVARVGRYVICNSKYTEPKILSYYKKMNYEIIHVNQGYAKCNVCIAGLNSVITEDNGIYKSVCNTDLNVLKLSSGGIELKNFPNGFIGGASGTINDSLVFFGNLNNHPQSGDILQFLKENKIKYLNSSDKNLSDWGSIINTDF